MSSCKKGVRELQDGKGRGMEEEGRGGKGRRRERQKEEGGGVETVSYSRDEQRKGSSRVAGVNWP